MSWIFIPPVYHFASRGSGLWCHYDSIVWWWQLLIFAAFLYNCLVSCSCFLCLHITLFSVSVHDLTAHISSIYNIFLAFSGDMRSPIRWPKNMTPTSSPSNRKIAVVSPIPYKCDDSDDEQFLDASNPLSRLPPIPASPSLTPPHKKLKSLRLFDTPHTPKSLVQRSNKRVCRPARSSLSDLTESSTPSPRIPLDPLKPQANVNPFTPSNSSHNLSNGSLGSGGVKRPRQGMNG